MRALDQDLIDKYNGLPKTGKSYFLNLVEKELGYAAAKDWIHKIMNKRFPPDPDQNKWLTDKINELYDYYHPETAQAACNP